MIEIAGVLMLVWLVYVAGQLGQIKAILRELRDLERQKVDGPPRLPE